MQLSKTYNPKDVEDKWYKYWLKNKFFHSTPSKNKEPYCIVIPPPNVTGVLHMGHMLNNTIQDVLVRKARMMGKETCWVPGTDHASIATEAKIVVMLKEKGIKKSDLTRKAFLKFAWEWKEKYGGIILEQLKKLGCSCDWDRTRFTMEDDLSEAVIDVFIDLYNKGYIYRGYRMVNWDPVSKTALSDEEVIHKEVNSKLYYVNYKLENSSRSQNRKSKIENLKSDEYLTIATTRPETILGDTAICVNPKDKRFEHLKGKKVLVPFINRAIPVIYDEYVDMEFGTGCLKVTPAHDVNDYELGIKHKLKSIDIFNNDGTLNENALLYIGEDRFVAREKIVKDLDKGGYLVKVEEIVNNIGFSERTNAVIEPRLSKQWFCSMKKLAKPALTHVMNDDIKLHPPKFKNMYRSWMENIRDWCISRQLWWGHRIPAWYYGSGTDDYVVAKTIDEALKLAIKKTQNPKLETRDLNQDEDVLDTWFSSWLWPISVFDGFKDPDNPDIKYYYPTDDLVTAPEILFFWVARMIIAGYEFRNDMPFKNVYLTGTVRDTKGRKMSKSLGNSPEPLKLIEKFGADGVRFGIMVSSPAGNDLLFEEKLCEQGRNFCNKIWNAFRLVKGWKVNETIEQPKHSKVASNWFKVKINKSYSTLDDNFSKYRISDALMTTYKLIWDDFCSWYLEIIKPGLNQHIDKSTYETTIDFFEQLLKLLHPFMPFITEEIWHLLRKRDYRDCIIVADWPKAEDVEVGYTPKLEGPEQAISQFEVATEVIVSIRNVRKKNHIPYKKSLNLYIKVNDYDHKVFDPIIKKLCNLSDIIYTDNKIEDSYSFVLKSNEYFVPLDEKIDKETEIEKINHELEYSKSFLVSVEKKLNNDGFINNAKLEIIKKEEQKKADAQAKIRILEKNLETLKNTTKTPLTVSGQARHQGTQR